VFPGKKNCKMLAYSAGVWPEDQPGKEEDIRGSERNQEWVLKKSLRSLSVDALL